MPADRTYVVHVTAPNDRNGNPRRLFLIMRGEYVRAVDEGFEGHRAIAGFVPTDEGNVSISATIAVGASEYKRLMREHG